MSIYSRQFLCRICRRGNWLTLCVTFVSCLSVNLIQHVFVYIYSIRINVRCSSTIFVSLVYIFVYAVYGHRPFSPSAIAFSSSALNATKSKNGKFSVSRSCLAFASKTFHILILIPLLIYCYNSVKDGHLDGFLVCAEIRMRSKWNERTMWMSQEG